MQHAAAGMALLCMGYGRALKRQGKEAHLKYSAAIIPQALARKQTAASCSCERKGILVLALAC